MKDKDMKDKDMKDKDMLIESDNDLDKNSSVIIKKTIYESKLNRFYFGSLIIRTSLNYLRISAPINNVDCEFLIPDTLDGFAELDNIISTLKQWKEDNFNVLKISENLRENYRQHINKAEITDSKKEDKESRKCAQEILVKLQSICPHEDVVRLNEAVVFQNLLSNDCSEERKCLMCNFHEFGMDKESFKKLKTFQWIATKVENKNEYLKFVPEILEPLKFSIHTCRHAAGGGL